MGDSSETKPTIAMIAAQDLDGYIATPEGKLPWGKLPADKQWYLDHIKGHTLVMGSTTYEAADHSREGNRLVVLSRKSREELDLPGDVLLINSPEEILDLKPLPGESEIFVTGGGQVFALMEEYADKIYLTIVEEHFPEAEGGVKFPALDESRWVVEWQESHQPDEANPHPHTFYIYTKRG